MFSSPLRAAFAAALLLSSLSAPALPGERQRKKGKDEKAPAQQPSKRGKTTKWNADSLAVAPKAGSGPQRIEFGPGTMSASLIGQVTRGEVRAYLLPGKAGQSVTIRIVGHNGTRPFFQVTPPEPARMQAATHVRTYPDAGERRLAATYLLDADGDYEVTVTELGGRPCTFTLVVDVR